MKAKNLNIQLITLGDHMVGKTSILTRFKENSFCQETSVTVGIDYVIKTVRIGSKDIRVRIWDTAGQDRFHTITHSFYAQCQGILFVFDVNNAQSLLNVSKWVNGAKNHADPSVIQYLIGNKIDLGQRKVTKEQGIGIANKNNMKYWEVSAKEGTNVDAAIKNLARDVYKANKDKFKLASVKIASKKHIRSSCC
eukprot:TRINITY_DN1787_c0_g3_i1.p2 TRINITY_DN1787_c0_g3~~TRINITY_DN1787_c0_g3_i1.p2  ORF type:complete len:194 (-),score=41.58 TRINITY_DN1787_c0_g3_i1:29-610(-)